MTSDYIVTDEGRFAPKLCSQCDGRGHGPDGDTLGDDCTWCEGSGEVADTERPVGTFKVQHAMRHPDGGRDVFTGRRWVTDEASARRWFAREVRDGWTGETMTLVGPTGETLESYSS